MNQKLMMNEKVPVIDNVGFVQYISHLGNDLTVVNAARVSFNKESTWEGDYQDAGFTIYGKTLSEKDKKLVNYLAKHKHWTPFAHPQITLRIKAPIFVRTQLFKHKVGFVENEVSRRYVTYGPELYTPRWRTAPTNGAKQGSTDFMEIGDDYNTCNRSYTFAVNECLSVYNMLLEKGIAPEQARSVLPQGTYTEWWWTGSLSAYARVYHQRSDAHAQWEVQQFAKAIGKIIEPLYPECWKVLTAKSEASV